MKLRKLAPNTYSAVSVNALLSKRWRDRAPYRTKRVYWRMLLLTALGAEVRRRFDTLKHARTWLDTYVHHDVTTADKEYADAD